MKQLAERADCVLPVENQVTPTTVFNTYLWNFTHCFACNDLIKLQWLLWQALNGNGYWCCWLFVYNIICNELIVWGNKQENCCTD